MPVNVIGAFGNARVHRDLERSRHFRLIEVDYLWNDLKLGFKRSKAKVEGTGVLHLEQQCGSCCPLHDCDWVVVVDGYETAWKVKAEQ